MTGGWWRRNRWGLVTLLPMAALALALPVQHAYGQYWKTAPRTAVNPAADGWVTFAGTRMRLDALTAQTKLTGDFGEPVTVPANLSIWRASISFQSTAPTATPSIARPTAKSTAAADPSGVSSSLFGCELTMSDVDGRSYAANPNELTDLGLGFDFASCAPDETSGKTPDHWTTVAYFVAPKTAHPTGVRVAVRNELPRYAWLTSR